MNKLSNFKQLLPHLAKMLSDSGEYLAHQTALYLLGLSSEPSSQVTIVSSRRRRNREIEGFEIIFVYHSNFEEKYSQTINVSGEQLRISNLEKTLIDLTKDQSYAPPLESMARLFCTIPYNLKLLLTIARATSDTVLKRISLLLAWSGRAAYFELPLKNFKRTPIKLDTREEKDLIWNNLFFTKLPQRLLRLPVSQPPRDLEEKTRLWMELKALPEFCEKQYDSGMIFIRETPEPKINKIVENYFVEIFKSFSSTQLEEFLSGYNAKTRVFPHSTPTLLRTFIHNRIDILETRRDELRTWVVNNLKANKVDRIEAAIFFGIKLNLLQEVYDKFNECSSELFYGGKFSIINFFADTFLNSEFKLTPQMLLSITKTYSMQEKYEKALAILEQAKVDAENCGGDLSSMGQLHYATGLVFNRMERSDDALAELFLAKESFLIDGNNEELARAELSLGNIYFSQGHPNSAKAYYYSGLIRSRLLKNKKLQGSFLANMGMVEYDVGCFPRATNYLTQAFAINKMHNNLWTASVVGMALGKLQLKLGHFSKAMRIFREIFPVRQEKGNASGIFEICSILAWICEIIGKTAAAKTYWNQADKFVSESLEPRSRFVGEMLRAMNHFFHKRYAEAESLFAAMLHSAETRDASGVHRSDCMHGLAVAKFFLGKRSEAYAFLDAARKAIGTNPGRLQLVQIEFMAALFFPEKFPEVDLKKCIYTLTQSGIYDPLWVHYAAILFATSCPEAMDYLTFHIDKTPPGTLKNLMQRFPILKQIGKSIASTNTRAGEFVTILSTEETQTLHLEDYAKWQEQYPADTLIFDAPAGKLIFNDNQERLKPGSIPHNILLQLFIGIPHPVEIESLYRSAWGMDFDPEYDFGAVKSSIQRLKHSLKKVAASASLQRKMSSKGLRAIRLSVSVPWFLVFK